MLSTLSLDMEMMNDDDDKVIRTITIRLIVRRFKGQKVYNWGQELVFSFSVCILYLAY